VLFPVRNILLIAAVSDAAQEGGITSIIVQKIGITIN